MSTVSDGEGVQLPGPSAAPPAAPCCTPEGGVLHPCCTPIPGEAPILTCDNPFGGAQGAEGAALEDPLSLALMKEKKRERTAPRTAAPSAPQKASDTQRAGRQPTAHAWFVELLDCVGSGPIGSKVRQCPAHGDAAPSLSIGKGDDGCVLLRCHAGCSVGDVLKALHLPWGRLFKPAPITADIYARTFCTDLKFPPLDLRGTGHPATRGMRLEAEHPYGARWWLLRYRHPVTGAKEISWECLNHKGERVPGLLGTPTRDLPLYRERDVRIGIAMGEPVLLVESESSVDALRGWYATTWAGGASSPPLDRLRDLLVDHHQVVIIGDNDESGRACVAQLAAALPLAHVLMPDLDGEDARDLYTRLGPDAFTAAINALNLRRNHP